MGWYCACRLPESRRVSLDTSRLLPQRSAASISLSIPLTCSLWSSRHDVLIVRLSTLRSSSLSFAKSLRRCSYSCLVRLFTQRFLIVWCCLTRSVSCASVVTHFVSRSKLADATDVSQYVAVWGIRVRVRFGLGLRLGLWLWVFL